jgi:hypothetical protein
VYRYLRSVRFFLLVGGVLVVFIALTTVIPQGMAGDEYAARFGRVPAVAVLLLGLNDFYRSPIFFLLGALLELNLVACTVPRLLRRIRRLRQGGARVTAFAPDAIHAGLAVLILSFVIGAAVREEHQFAGAVGAELTAGSRTFRVLDARAVENESGVLVSWVIHIGHQGQVHRLAVNRPIVVGGYRLHFRHYERSPLAELTGPAGDAGFELLPGEALADGQGAALRFQSADEDGRAVFVLSTPAGDRAPIRLTPGDEVAGLTYRPGGHTTIVGFSATRNPARPAQFAGFLLVALGLSAYAIDKVRSHG